MSTRQGSVPQVGDWLRRPDGTACFIDGTFDRGCGSGIAVMQGAWHGCRCLVSPLAHEAAPWPRAVPTPQEAAVVRDFVAGMVGSSSSRPDEWARYHLALQRLDDGLVGDMGR